MAKPSQLAVFGNPIEHSRSPEIHAAFAEQAGMQLFYSRILVPEDEFESTVTDFFDAGGLGCNVTVPCKGDAWKFVDEATGDAELAQAVNTISRREDGRLKGDNTDGPGLVSDLKKNLGWPLKDRRVLVLGAGGAVRGVLSSLLKEAPVQVHLYNRTHATAVELVDRFSQIDAQPSRVSAVEKAELADGYDVIINGTSAGLADQRIDLPANIVKRDSHCYDMVYGRKAQAFLNWAQAHGAGATSDGLGMLVEQAALSFQIWFGHEVNTAPVIQMLRESEFS
ncbi:MAG: shikimate dehydrogenase [Pseudomonadales bacterium]|nr:shikimate dehydrogenase [Pseudomonadales bacterium]MBO6596589.1 shikimate dehydrogenase [Pseudomonadales bacterium]MBO6823422.1 shikimate dehydrogenase [Pseudomonadales bacterium]